MESARVNGLPNPAHIQPGWPRVANYPEQVRVASGVPWPKVSIVTPSYNQGQFLEETIRSVLLQGYPNLEYMIIDGGSTDNSTEIIRKYADWLTYWVSEPDNGQAHAINKGWMRSQGDILAYLNSDDTLAPGALHRVGETFLAHPDVSVVYGDCNLVDGDGLFLRRLNSQVYNRAELFLANYIQQSSAFIRRNAFEQAGKLDESLHMSMDYDYWVRLALASHEMFYLPEVLSNARLVSGTKTKSLSTRFLGDTLYILDKAYSNPDIAYDLRRVRRAAYGNAWRLGGVRYFDAGKRYLAITSIFNSLCWDPFPGWKPLALALLVILQSAIGVHWRSALTLEKTKSVS